MSKAETIWQAAFEALTNLGGRGTLDDIFSEICRRGLYDFGTTDPNDAPHVLETEIKRKCLQSNRTNKTGNPIFNFEGDGIYSLKAELELTGNQKKMTGSKRIHRARDKEDIIASLTNEKTGVFREIWRVLLFAAQIGFREGRRTPLASIDTGKGIDQTTFGNSSSWPGVCYLMALVEEDSADLLSGGGDSEERRITMFQEYANTGLEVLQDFFNVRNPDIDGVLSFIDQTSRTESQSVDLDLGI